MNKAPTDGGVLYTPLDPDLEVEARKKLDLVAPPQIEVECSHDVTQWQIATDENFENIVHDSTAENNLTSLPLPDSLSKPSLPSNPLLPGNPEDATFHWRARFKSEDGAVTDWSTPTTFSVSTAPPPVIKPPSSGSCGGSDIADELCSYDANSNDFLETPEFLTTIDDWIDRRLSNEAFFAAIDLWVNEESISSAGVIRPQIQARQLSGQVRFAAHGAARLSVNIYTLSGERLYHDATTGHQLAWRMRDEQGQPVANGIYLYRMTTLGPDGQILQTGIRKLAILR